MAPHCIFEIICRVWDLVRFHNKIVHHLLNKDVIHFISIYLSIVFCFFTNLVVIQVNQEVEQETVLGQDMQS